MPDSAERGRGGGDNNVCSLSEEEGRPAVAQRDFSPGEGWGGWAGRGWLVEYRGQESPK